LSDTKKHFAKMKDNISEPKSNQATTSTAPYTIRATPVAASSSSSHNHQPDSYEAKLSLTAQFLKELGLNGEINSNETDRNGMHARRILVANEGKSLDAQLVIQAALEYGKLHTGKTPLKSIVSELYTQTKNARYEYENKLVSKFKLVSHAKQFDSMRECQVWDHFNLDAYLGKPSPSVQQQASAAPSSPTVYNISDDEEKEEEEEDIDLNKSYDDQWQQ